MKKIWVCLIAALLLAFPATVFAADTPAIGGKLDRNVSRVSTYIGEGATSFQTLVLRAANNWMNPGWDSDVGFAYAPNDKGTMLDIYCYPKSHFGGNMSVAGMTKWYNSDGSINPWPDSGTYRYAIIECNTNFLNSISIDRRTAVFAHEMGHAFGLDHNDSTKNSIMYSDTHTRALYVQKVDTNTVNKLY